MAEIKGSSIIVVLLDIQAPIDILSTNVGHGAQIAAYKIIPFTRIPLKANAKEELFNLLDHSNAMSITSNNFLKVR